MVSDDFFLEINLRMSTWFFPSCLVVLASAVVSCFPGLNGSYE